MRRSEQELLATDFQSLTHPEDLEAELEQMRRALAGDIKGFETLKRYLHSDGGVIWAALSVSLVRDDHGEPELPEMRSRPKLPEIRCPSCPTGCVAAALGQERPRFCCELRAVDALRRDRGQAMDGAGVVDRRLP